VRAAELVSDQSAIVPEIHRHPRRWSQSDSPASIPVGRRGKRELHRLVDQCAFWDDPLFIYDSRYIVYQNPIARDYYVKCDGVRRRAMSTLEFFYRQEHCGKSESF
jgi:hypothetical protein